MTRPLPSLLFAAVSTIAAAVAQEPAAAVDPVRATILRAIDWIARQAVPVDGGADAVLFPAAAGSKAPLETRIYGGSAGVLIFVENAAAVLHDERCRALADATAAGLRARHRSGGNRGNGLYTGDAGVGHAFLVRSQLRGDAQALATAVEIGDELLARGRKDGDELSWDAQVDVIFGAAGTALFLLELGEASKQPRFVDAAKAAARWLCTEAEPRPSTVDPQRQLATWLFRVGSVTMHMPNFSHGTAGVAYALARVASATGDQACLQKARDGAEWLLEHAVADGDGLKWCAKEGQPACMGGWCHGPAGTGRLFLWLHAATGEQRYLDAALGGARWVMAYQEQGKTAAAGAELPYYPPSFCCGVAGVVDFFCDLYRATGKPEFAAFARKAGQYLIDVAIRDGDGVKWKNGAQAPGAPVAGRSGDCNVDLMLGASGEAMALLRLLTLDAAEDPIRHLPDRRVGRPAAAPPGK